MFLTVQPFLFAYQPKGVEIVETGKAQGRRGKQGYRRKDEKPQVGALLGRQPPYSQDAEIGVLGSMMLMPANIDELAGGNAAARRAGANFAVPAGRRLGAGGRWWRRGRRGCGGHGHRPSPLIVFQHIGESARHILARRRPVILGMTRIKRYCRAWLRFFNQGRSAAPVMGV